MNSELITIINKFIMLLQNRIKCKMAAKVGGESRRARDDIMWLFLVLISGLPSVSKIRFFFNISKTS
jgi:hypothetical protein